MANEITVRVKAEDQASSVIKGVEKNATGLGKVLGDVGKIAGGFLAANVVAGGVQKLTGFLNDSIEAAKESKLVNAQLDAVLKSTGNAAGVTAQQVAGLAAKLEKQSLFEDEAILKGQNLLLTFTNIGNAADGTSHIFDDATKIMIDMAQAMGTDASGAAIQLGKALNDPTNGISALTRVGVTFTEEQKKQIETMQEAGDIAGAQAIIIAELNKEFGGSAKAASDAAGAQEVYKDKMNDLKEQIGEKMLPIQLKLQEAQAAAVTFIAEKAIPQLEELYAKHYPALTKIVDSAKKSYEDFAAAIGITTDAISTGIGWYEGAERAMAKLGIEFDEGAVLVTAFERTLSPLTLPLRLAREAVDDLSKAFSSLKRAIESVPTSVNLPSLPNLDPRNLFRAAGGPVSAGQPYIVGERGPELFVPGQSGGIVPNGQLGGSVNVTMHVENLYGDQASGKRVGNDIGYAISLRRAGVAA